MSRLFATALCASLALAGCQQGAAESAGGSKDNQSPDEPGAGAQPGCVEDADCVAVGTSCCECPSFATLGDSGFAGGCEDVDCQPPSDCPLVEAACVSGSCRLRCQALVTEQICSEGFARDEFGCLLDECGTSPSPATPECAGDAGCARVPSDCCGCERGGADTAVAADQVDAYLAALDCPTDPQCPEVNVCDPTQEPRCVDGTCRLAASAGEGDAPDGGLGGGNGGSGGGGEGDYCGTPDYGSCAAGMVCVLNDPDAQGAVDLGVGICRPE